MTLLLLEQKDAYGDQDRKQQQRHQRAADTRVETTSRAGAQEVGFAFARRIALLPG